MMRLKLVVLSLGLLVAMIAIAGPAAGGVNQGDSEKVLRVDNKGVWCKEPMAGHKIEGGLGTTIEFRSSDAIDFVTVKSGKGAEVVSYRFDTFWGSITLSKDVSNYVVWTCPGFDKKDAPPPPKTDPPKTDDPPKDSGAHPAAGGVNQGDSEKVLRVDNKGVWCKEPMAGHKIEGGLGTTIEFRSSDAIDFVTVKSGKGAEVVSYRFDTFWGSITLSKDVSNYVVWTCPGFDKKDVDPSKDVEPPKDQGPKGKVGKTGKGKEHSLRGACRPRVGVVVRGKLVSVDAKARTFIVLVKKGNRQVRHLVGEEVIFRLGTKGKVRYPGKATLADLEAGYRVKVVGRACKAKLAEKDETPQLYAHHVKAKSPRAHAKKNNPAKTP